MYSVCFVCNDNICVCSVAAEPEAPLSDDQDGKLLQMMFIPKQRAG